MDLAWTADFVVSLAASCAHSILRVGLVSLKRIHLSAADSKALERAYAHAFESVLRYANARITPVLAEHTRELFESFASNPKVATSLLGLSLSDEIPPLRLLRDLFVEAGYDPNTLPISFDEVVDELIRALGDGLHEEAASPGSPLFNKVFLARILELDRKLKESQLNIEKVVDILSMQQKGHEIEHGNAIQDYKQALYAYCNQFTYASMLSRSLPLLSAVYVWQSWENLTPRSEEQRLITAEEALRTSANLLLIGESGSGKSSAANSISLLLLDSWNRGDRWLLPIKVSANGLARRSGSLSECLHEQIRHELGRFLKRGLPADLFEHPPSVGARWLVIVDGLDEIVEPDLRVRLPKEIQGQWVSESPCYKFLLTSRSTDFTEKLMQPHLKEVRQTIKEGPAASKHPDLRIFGLRPLTIQEIYTFVHKWFNACTDSSPDDARRFLSQVEESRIRELTRIPLLVTMAAIVFAENRDTPIPQYRAGLYKRFVSILVLGEEAKRGTRQAFRREWADRYGTRGEGLADSIFGERLQLLKHLAKRHQEGGHERLSDEAMRYARSRSWLEFDDPEWQKQQLETLLERTGLLTWHDRTLSFIHKSFQEYLAACWFSDLNPDLAEPLPFDIGDPHWKEVFLFLLAIWSEGGHDVTSFVQRALAAGDLPLASAALAEGASVESRVDDAIVEDLVVSARKSSYQRFGNPELFDPVHALERLVPGREKVLLGLCTIAMDQGVVPERRVQAGLGLIVANRDDLSREAFLSVGADSRWDRDLRMEVRDALHHLDKSERTLWMSLAHNGEVSSSLRLDAAVLLASGCKQFDELLALARDIGLSSIVRRRAAAALAETAGPCEQAAQAWLSLAGHKGLGAAEVRIEAVQALECMGQLDALKSLAVDQQIHVEARIEAIRVLGAGERYSESPGLLLSFARDDSLPTWLRVRAVLTLVELHYVKELLFLVKEHDLSVQIRTRSARGLGTLHSAETLIPVINDTAIHLEVRSSAALSIFGDDRVVVQERLKALLLLRSIGDEDTARELQSIMPTLRSIELRREATEAAIQIQNRCSGTIQNG